MRKKNSLSFESKLIFLVIFFLILLFSPISILDNLEKIKIYIINIYNQYFGIYPIYIEILILIFPFIVFVIYKLIIKNRSNYTEDIIYNIKWTWSYRGKDIINLQCFCPTCNEELIYDDTSSNYTLSVSKIDFICENCHRVVGSFHNDNRKNRSHFNVKKEIERVINKNALNIK